MAPAQLPFGLSVSLFSLDSLSPHEECMRMRGVARGAFFLEPLLASVGKAEHRASVQPFPSATMLTRRLISELNKWVMAAEEQMTLEESLTRE